jgi:hypothetical protein
MFDAEKGKSGIQHYGSSYPFPFLTFQAVKANGMYGRGLPNPIILRVSTFKALHNLVIFKHALCKLSTHANTKSSCFYTLARGLSKYLTTKG